MAQAEVENPVAGTAASSGRSASADEREAVGRSDPLLECLMLIARAHGLGATRESALAGLPLARGGLTPSSFSRAAVRAGLASNIVRRRLEGLNDALLPTVLLLHDGEACVLVGWSDGRRTAQVIFPELGDAAVDIAASELADRYLGRAIYVRPQFRFDARVPVVRPTRGRHWFWGVVAENGALYRDVVLAALMINLLGLAIPLFIRNVYDRVVPNNAIDTLWVLAIGVTIVLVSELALRIVRGRFVDLAASRIDVKLSAHIMERVLAMRLEHRPASAGSFAANLRAFESVRDFIGSATVLALVDLPFALLFVAVIGWIAWPMVPVFAVATLFLLFYALAVQSKMHELAESAYRTGAQRNATLVEGLVGIETVKAIGAEGVIQRKWEQSAAALARITADLRLATASVSNVATLVRNLVTVAVVVIGVHLLAENALSGGGLLACFLLGMRAMVSIGQVIGLLGQYNTAATALTSLDRMMVREPERSTDARYLEHGRLRGGIELHDVLFRYPGVETPALQKVSLRIEAGEHVAILGRVGSGKTTIEKLVLGLYRPCQGAVLIDGVDARQIDPAELRHGIGYVPQDVTLFYGSLRENITMAMPHADDAAVREAARIAGLRDFVDTHPHGFDMPIGERGESLSGGQRQQVAIARAVVADPSILLLDEPTASMDQSSEVEIKRNLAAFARGKTLVIVTHRTSLLDLVDRIVVIDKGHVVADGPKAEVMEALRQGRIGKVA